MQPHELNYMLNLLSTLDCAGIPGEVCLSLVCVCVCMCVCLWLESFSNLAITSWVANKAVVA